MADDLNFIDDNFPFDLSKGVEWNIVILKSKLLRDGFTEEEADKLISEKKSKYFNEDGTRKD
jgi:hypothetical protein